MSVLLDLIIVFSLICVGFTAAFVLACIDPIWKQRVSMKEGWRILVNKDN